MKTIKDFNKLQLPADQLKSLNGGMDARRVELDHVGAYNFRVEISGITAGFFKGVSGLSAELEAIEFQDGDDLFL